MLVKPHLKVRHASDEAMAAAMGDAGSDMGQGAAETEQYSYRGILVNALCYRFCRRGCLLTAPLLYQDGVIVVRSCSVFVSRS